MNENQAALCTLRVSSPRHAFGVAVLVLLGALVLYLAIDRPPENPFWLLFLIGVTVTSFYMAMRFWSAGSMVLELREQGLFLGDGTRLCAIEDIRSVERGAFAFKPSNGFLIRLKDRAQSAWVPGLYWRYRRLIGVGGITPAAQGKLMADMIAAMLVRE